MNKAFIETLAEQYALNYYLSDRENSSFADIREAFYNDIIPDDVTIWDVFENESLEVLADYLELTKNDFLNFYKDATQ